MEIEKMRTWWSVVLSTGIKIKMKEDSGAIIILTDVYHKPVATQNNHALQIEIEEE